MGEEKDKQKTEGTYPVIPLPPGRFIFPQQKFVIATEKHQSVGTAKDALTREKKILLLNKKKEDIEIPEPNDLHEIGVIVKITDHIQKADSLRLVVEGIARVRTIEFSQTGDFLQARAQIVKEAPCKSDAVLPLMKEVTEAFDKYKEECQKRRPTQESPSPNIPQTDDPGFFADSIASIIAAYTDYRPERFQAVLEAFDTKERLEKLKEILNEEMDLLEFEMRVLKKVGKQILKNLGLPY
ncbi:hypothetical protein FJZ31_01720 [Candidatus Poribacteria bacterium]|nr:hypothetical protein [Candidatus Poribacteria bacterium]